MRTVADLQRLARASGCTLRRVHRVGPELVGEYDCPDAAEGRPLSTAILLSALTAEDGASDPFDPKLVLAIRSAGILAAPTAHRYVQSRVKFREEEPETFATPSVTLRDGVGDCDDSERVLVSLARAAHIPARLVFFLQDGIPAHASAQLWSAGAWQWAETTIPARFAEHPFDAMTRLGLGRPDLDGTPIVLENGRAVPLAQATGRGQGMGTLRTQAPRGRMSLGDLATPARGRPRTLRAIRGLVPRVKTPVTAQDVANAIAEVWPSVVAGDPGSAIGVLVAQSAFETGNWSSIWNYNVGNVAATSGDFFQMTANPAPGVTSAQAPHTWRSYDTLTAAVMDWLTIFVQGYPQALGNAVAGNIPGFVAGLWQGWGRGAHYFQGDDTAFAEYLAGVQARYAVYGGTTPNGTPNGAAVVASNALAAAVDDVEDVDGVGVSGIGLGGAIAVVAAAAVAGIVLAVTT